MFEKVFGLPAHPLVVHAAVVLVPIAVLTAFVYVLIPRLRRTVGWVLLLSSVSGAVASVIAVETGDRFAKFRGVTPDMAEHGGFGLDTRNMALLLAVVSVVLVIVENLRARRVARPQQPEPRHGDWTMIGDEGPDSSGSTVLTVVSLVLSLALLASAVGAAVSVGRAGDTGARMVWSTE